MNTERSRRVGWCFALAAAAGGLASQAEPDSSAPRGNETVRDLGRAPISVSYPGAEAFGAATPAVPAPAAVRPERRTIRMAPGAVVEVQRRRRERRDPWTGEAFYLPPEAAGIVRLEVQIDGADEVFLLRGVAQGETLGGVVDRRWLDEAGRRPGHTVAEARIQAALKAAPQFIVVE